MLFTIVAILVIAGIGAAIGYFTRKSIAQSQVNSAEGTAAKILADAKLKEQDMLLKAREKALALIDESKKEQDALRHELKDVQVRLEKRETTFEQKLLEIQDRHAKLVAQAERVKVAQAEADAARDEQMTKLQTIS